MIRFSGLAHPKHWKYKIGIAGLVCIAANIAIYDQLFTCTLKEKKLRFKVKNINHTNVVNHFLRVRILYTPFCYLSLTILAISYGYVEHVYLMWSKYFVRNVIRTMYTHVSGWLLPRILPLTTRCRQLPIHRRDNHVIVFPTSKQLFLISYMLHKKYTEMVMEVTKTINRDWSDARGKESAN